MCRTAPVPREKTKLPGRIGRWCVVSARGSIARRSPRSARHRALEPRCRQHTERAIGARSEWSPGVLAGALSGAAVRDCSTFTERDLKPVPQRALTSATAHDLDTWTYWCVSARV